MDKFVELTAVSKHFNTKKGRFQALADVNLSIARGEFVALGRPLQLKDITCPLYLLAGESDDITPAEQVFAAKTLCGTPADQVEAQTVPGGHVGLFMGKRTLDESWPKIGAWIARQR